MHTVKVIQDLKKSMEAGSTLTQSSHIPIYGKVYGGVFYYEIQYFDVNDAKIGATLDW